MGDGSPLFHSALDLLAHACEHYVSNQERDRRLAVLHLANAVELLLKDRLIDLGISIFENPKQTKSINQVFKDLQDQKVLIPHKNVLELLIDERNNIQHRFSSSDSITVKYYFDNTLKFFDEFMNAAFGLEIKEYLVQLLNSDVLSFVYPESESSKDVLLQAKRVSRVHPSSSVVTAWMEIEKKVDELRTVLEKETKKTDSWVNWPVSSFFRELSTAPITSSIDVERLRREIISLSAIRNKVVHADTEMSDADAQNYIERVENILPKIGALKEDLIKMKKPQAKAAKKPTRKPKDNSK